MKILITAGHGGTDPGAIGNGYYERDIAYEFVKLVANYINSNYSNISVDYQHEKNDNGEFYSDYGSSKYEYFLSFHFNAGGGQGTENLIKYSNSLATVINSILGTHFTNRGVKYRQDLYVLNIGFDTLTEVCFIDSSSDMKYYQANKSKIIEDVATAIADKLGATSGGSTHPSTPTEPTSKEYVYKQYAETGSVTFTHDTKVFGSLDDAIDYKNSVVEYKKGEKLNKYEYVYLTKYESNDKQAYSYIRYQRSNGKKGYFAYRDFQKDTKVGNIK